MVIFPMQQTKIVDNRIGMCKANGRAPQAARGSFNVLQAIMLSKGLGLRRWAPLPGVLGFSIFVTAQECNDL